MRLDKYLATLGIGTRSEVKKLISKGQIIIDGKTVKDPGLSVNGTVFYKGEALPPIKDQYYVMMHKPAGYVCSKDEPGKKLVYSLFGEAIYQKLNSIGRLDEDTEGLLVFTDDGKLNHFLMSPNKHIEKEYYVELDGPLQTDFIEAFEKGIDIGDDTVCKPAKLIPGNRAETCNVILTEGRYHQVKRMFAAVGRTVTYLKRVRLGQLELKDLPVGSYRELSQEEVDNLWKKEESLKEVSVI